MTIIAQDRQNTHFGPARLKFDYHDDQGRVVAQKIRIDLGAGEKTFVQRQRVFDPGTWRPRRSGMAAPYLASDGRFWVDGVENGTKALPYRPDPLEEMLRGGWPDRIYLPEGERDADAILLKGEPATTILQVGAEYWKPWAEYFRGYSGVAIILVDNDAIGARYGLDKRQALADVGVRVEMVRPPEGYKDVRDMLEDGKPLSTLQSVTVRELRKLAKEATPSLSKAGYPSPWIDDGVRVGRTLTNEKSGEKFDPAQTDWKRPVTKVKARRPILDVSNEAVSADWLRSNLGRGMLSGMFLRNDGIVHTPRVGEEGYEPLSEDSGNDDGPAQIRKASPDYLTARIQYTFRCQKTNEDGKVKSALFPYRAAKRAYDAADMMPNLRRLAGVVHVPVFRPDGTLITDPGYDSETRLLYLPEAGLEVRAIPDKPSDADVGDAVALVSEMIADFPFDDENHRTNYLGMLLTPTLRTLAPPPYKMAAIEAHQRGSGKTLLANCARNIHGGVFRSEIPTDESEIRKQVTSILSVTTGPIVVLDNLSGILRSSTLAGLLTSDRWDDRPLGSTSWVQCKNDRLWMVTGNNLNLGGDLPRRTLRSSIDPNDPKPEERTGFRIADLEGWVKERRGDLLWALLTMVRAWVVAGRELTPQRTSDSYSRWVRTVDGILQNAGVGGIFDHTVTHIQPTEDEDWRDFLAAVYHVFADGPWTVKELVRDIETNIPLDALPGELADRAGRSPHGVMSITRSLGKWLANREKQWAGNYSVRRSGHGPDGKAVRWRIVTN